MLGPIHQSGMTQTHTHTHAVYGNQYVDQRSPALQQCHSFSALYANTARARVRDRHPIVGADYHCFTNGSNGTEKKGFPVVFGHIGVLPLTFFSECVMLRSDVVEVITTQATSTENSSRKDVRTMLKT